MDRVLALPVVSSGMIPSTNYGVPALSEVIPKHRSRHKL